MTDIKEWGRRGPIRMLMNHVFTHAISSKKLTVVVSPKVLKTGGFLWGAVRWKTPASYVCFLPECVPVKAMPACVQG